MRRFFSAMQFITIIPFGRSTAFDPKGMAPFFPVVGIVLGAMVLIVDRIALQLWPESVAALIDVVFLIIITGALHLDGLGDTADGLYGNRPKKQALAIMKDSRIGAMGLVAIVCVTAIKWGGIMSLDNNIRSLMLLIIPAYARAGMLFGIKFLEYGRPEGGTGHPFFGHTMKPAAFWGLLIPVLLSLFAGWRGVWVNIIFVLVTALILLYYKKRIGCITGDMLGAMCETTEAALFLLVSIKGIV